MAQRGATTERLGSFSDAVFAVIITVMVLELKPPEHPTFAALLPLWPTALSYVVSYYFIAIVWLNHHHLLRFFPHATSRVIWINFVHLFMVSLVPFSTAWVADTTIRDIFRIYTRDREEVERFLAVSRISESWRGWARHFLEEMKSRRTGSASPGCC